MGPAASPADNRDWLYRGSAPLAGGLVLLYAFLTQQVWEDYYITFRSSRNLVDGAGLVFQAGERVHTFTSPLGVLLPALGYRLTGSEAGALWFFRVLSAGAVAATAALVLKRGRESGWSRLTAAAVLMLGVLDAKQIGFSANGMEAGLLMLFTALAWGEINRTPAPRWPWLAAAYAGLMWTRPDAFLIAGAMTLGWAIFRPGADTDRLTWAKRIALGIGAGVLLYLPWTAWTWSYYCSPVPQTIVAKSAYMPEGISIQRILTAPLRCLTRDTGLDGLFAPHYFHMSSWQPDLVNICRALARIAAFAWLVPALARPARAASFATLLGGIYFNQIMPYPWYYPPWTLLGAISLAGVIELGLRATAPRARSLTRIACGCAIALAAAQVVCVGINARHQQAIIEDAGRRQVGLWLKANARPGDTVFLESLGYIGYFSTLKTYDFPGLSSREVSTLMKSGEGSYDRLIAALKPDWIAIRPSEYHDQQLARSEAMKSYDLAGVSDQKAAVDAVPFLPGRNLLEFDAVFLIYRRLPASQPAATVPPATDLPGAAPARRE